MNIFNNYYGVIFFIFILVLLCIIRSGRIWGLFNGGGMELFLLFLAVILFVFSVLSLYIHFSVLKKNKLSNRKRG